MTRHHPPCAMYEHFTTQGYPDCAKVGEGRCMGFDMDGQPERFEHAAARACVIFGAAKNPGSRRAFLAKHEVAGSAPTQQATPASFAGSPLRANDLVATSP